ncbi:DoxX family protein [Dictyobacter kobayashii]|uniref:Membrane protein n=1 Tax=Dictyobacter kobayashii TaxID=2014872 RepID=A0A402AUE5_9CHLR|nr:DoxX family protein [Dictyobacter kobayashii]GCE22653.1 membrane protein [Dictyobacter kobayashii]
MFIAYIVLAVIMSLLLVMSGVGKLRRDPRIVHSIHEVIGVPLRWLPWLAACEFAGAAGLLIGIVWWPLGVAAAIGVIAYFICASIAHMRVRDFKGLSGPLPILLFAVIVLVLRILSI